MLKNQNYHPLDLPLHVVLAGWLYRRLGKPYRLSSGVVSLSDMWKREDESLSEIFLGYSAQNWFMFLLSSIISRYQQKLHERYTVLCSMGAKFVVFIPFDDKKDD